MPVVEPGKRLELLEITESAQGRAASKALGEFLASAERKATLSTEDRLRIVEQALVMLEMNYVHLPMKRALHAIDPIQQLKLLRFSLEEGSCHTESAMDFHRRMLSIFGSTRDLHTLYLLPAPFKECAAYLPFLIEQCFVKIGGRLEEIFIVSQTVQWNDPSAAGTSPSAPRFERGVQVLGWNGVPIRRAIEINGESQSGSNPAARFARGLDNLTIRPLNSSLPPDEHWVDILFRTRDGLTACHREYWLVDNKEPRRNASAIDSATKRAAMDIKRTRIIEVKKKLYPRQNTAGLGSIKDSLYAVKKTIAGRDFGYIRLFSFDVDDAHTFVKQFCKLITKDGFPQDGLILDVRSNPGGNIRAAESLLQLFCPYPIEPELFEFINSPLNYQICRKAPKSWDLERWARSISEAVTTGATYSAGYPLTLEKSCNGIGQLYYGPVVLITDALSYSATDIFAAGFQDNEVGTVLGTSGNTGAGGANFWAFDDLLGVLDKDPKSPFRKLPKGAELIVAMRRSVRVRGWAGAPLEEFGVEPEVRHYMTPDDILNENKDLLARAAAIIRRKPVFHLLAKPFAGTAARGIVLSARSTVPATNQRSTIARLDISVDDRPLRSIEAKDGEVTSRKVSIGKSSNGRATQKVEVVAVDKHGLRVAFRRIHI